ncbi:DedA family protein [Bacillus horti]|uniref:Membrane protein DedA with SNARE-associated domain n=1 Tax=Caldalkalibacillus horti TaxID=77523 RepID=A0ABT9W067_9BACI|nr:DedA family protein [Bacillus horti]MDQ0166260.1 membrane protein DedA with SNARE-associated domain [Bacillus horti]
MKLLELVEQLFAQYGYLVLLIGLPLDAIALPIPPGNTTLTYTGYLSFKGVLDLLPAIAAAFGGAAIGMTITYWIGYNVGFPLTKRYGKWLSVKLEHLEKTRKNYEKYGNWFLTFSFFMPGIRQFIGYFVGIIRIPFRTFAFYAYLGAALWVLAFVGIGFIFGEQWQYVFSLFEAYLKYIFIGLCVLLAVLGYLRLRKFLKMKKKMLSFNKERQKPPSP